MVVAKIRVTGILAQVIFRKDIPSGIIGAQVDIEYADSLWTNLKKTVVFRGCGSRDILNAENVVTIPQEVVSCPGTSLQVGIYGVDDDNCIAIPTLWADLGRVRGGADPSGDESADPQLPVWAQLQEQIDDLRESGTGGGLNITSDGEGNVSITASGSASIISDGNGNVTIG